MSEVKKTVPAFFEEVYTIVAQIPEGKVLSYGHVARLMGRPHSARRVGQAMWSASAVPGLPCHRVVNGEGRTAPNWKEQRQLLEAEGVTFRKSGRVDMIRHTWEIL
jgi:methylated-DNA-protein-cysteine methyltransferase-like protein